MLTKATATDFQTRLLVLGNRQILFPCLTAICPRFPGVVTEGIQLIHELFGNFPRFIQQAEICRVSYRLLSYRCINQQLSTIFFILLNGTPWRTDLFKDYLLKSGEHVCTHSLANIYKQAGCKRRRILIAAEANEVLEVRVFLDLHHRFLITQVQLMLYDQGTYYQAGIPAGATLSRIHCFVVAGSQVVPWDNRAPFHPAVIRIESPTKWKTEAFETELLVARVPDHVQAFYGIYC